MRSLRAAAFVVPIVLFMLVPATASAVTQQEIVRLTKAGVSDQVIVALIEQDRTIFDLTSDQLLALKRDGVSEAVVLAMLRSGRQELPAPPQPAPTPDVNAGPIVGFVGHGPDRPNVGSYSDFPMYGSDVVAAPYTVPYAVPYVVPYPFAVRVPPDHRRMHDGPVLPPAPVTSPLAFGAPLPVANTLGAVSARGIFFTNPSSAAGIFFTPAGR